MKVTGFVRFVFAAGAFALAAGGLFAQDINRLELEANQAAVNFINYEGPYTRIDTVEQIRAIGLGLGQAVRNGAERPGADNRYFVIHSVSEPEDGRLDADIFGIGVDAQVDHIRNLRLILQGFFEGAYGYSAADAALLARYVTIYNAVFRGDENFFTSRYKTAVQQYLNTEQAGLSIRFDEWPGQTLMTIPLGTGEPGSLSAVDTSSLTDREVTEQMRRDGGGIEERQGMVDLKEREAAEANQSATLQREAIAGEEANIQKDRADAAAARQQAAQAAQQAQQAIQQAQQDAAAGRVSQEEAQRRQQEAQQQQQAADRQTQEAEQQEKEIAQREQAQEQARQQADATQARADQKTAEAQQERQEIAADQQSLIESGTVAAAGRPGGAGAVPGGAAGTTPAAAAAPSSALGVSIVQTDSALGQLVRLNTSSGAVLQTSQLNTINGRTLVFTGGKVFAVAGIARGDSAIRLVEINPNTLEMVKQGDDDIHPQSLLWNNGADLYAITVSGGRNYLGRFNTDLAIQSKSDIEVHPWATCIIQGGNVLTQNTDGSPLLLNAQTLK
jgi:hypothetical protein